MKQTMALIEFMNSTGVSLIEAVGLIDQLHEIEKTGKEIGDMTDNQLTVYLREPVKRLAKLDLIKNYFQYKSSEKSELKSEYNKNYLRRKKFLERERSVPSSPLLPPTPPINPLLSPEERESENAPLHLRCRPPEGAHPPQKRFSAPTVDEVRAYASEKGYTDFEADRFVDFYASKGWMVGKSPMKDWRAAVRGWASRNRQDHPEQAPRVYRDADYENDW